MRDAQHVQLVVDRSESPATAREPFWERHAGNLVLMIAAIAMCVVILYVIPALAADGDVSTEIPWWGHVVIAIATPLGTLLLGLLAKALAHLSDYLATKFKIEKLRELDEWMIGAITSIWEAEAKALKDAAADGKLTKEEAQRFKALAIEGAKQHFGLHTLSKAAGVAGDALNDYLGHRVEANLASVRRAERATRTPDPT